MGVEGVPHGRHRFVIQDGGEVTELHREIVDGKFHVHLRNDQTVPLVVEPVDAGFQSIVDAEPPVRAVDHVDVTADSRTATARVRRPIQVQPELVHLVLVLKVVGRNRAVETRRWSGTDSG